MVFQNFALLPHRSVLDNVAYGLEIQGELEGERYEQAKEAIKLVGLEGYEDSMPSDLSGGMKQRVGLARALASDPDVMLMDEAFSALDPLIRSDMQDELLDLQEKVNKTIIFVTHDLDEALKIGDRIALMKDGRIVQIGTAEDILTNPADEYVEMFVEGVDRSKVLTAEAVMKKPEPVVTTRAGLRTALVLAKDTGKEYIFIVEKEGKRFRGIIKVEDAAEALKSGRAMDEILKTDVPTVSPETYVNEIIPLLMQFNHPIPVVNENRRLIGVIRAGSVIGAIGGA
jgi:glycine betaine/proline transport system ATP-binding protein